MSASNYFPNGSVFNANVPGFGSSYGFYVRSDTPVNKWLFTNGSSNTIFFRMSSNTALATQSLSLPSDNTAAKGQYLAPGDTAVIGLPNAESGVDGSRFISNLAVVATGIASGYSYMSVLPVLQDRQ